MKRLTSLANRPLSRLISGTIAANAINAISIPIITYIFEPDAYAVFGLFTMFVSIGNAVITMKLGQLYMNENSMTGKAQNLKAFLLVMPITSVLLVSIFTVFVVNGWFGFSTVPLYYSLLLFIILFGVGSYNYFRLVNLKTKQYTRLQILEPIKASARAFFQIILGLIGLKFAALPLGEAIGRYAGIWSLVKSSKSRMIAYAKVVKFRDARNYIKKNRRFMTMTSMSGIVNVIGTTIMLPAMIQLYGEDLAGEYGLVVKLLTIPIVLVGAAAADVFHEKCSNNLDRIPHLFKKFGRNLFLFSVLVFTTLYFVVEPLSAWAFNEDWSNVGRIAQLLIPWFFGVLAISPLSRILLVLRKEHLKFIYDGFALVGMLVIMWLANEYNYEWQTYLLYSGLYWLVAYLVYFLIMVYSVRMHKKKFEDK